MTTHARIVLCLIVGLVAGCAGNATEIPITGLPPGSNMPSSADFARTATTDLVDAVQIREAIASGDSARALRIIDSAILKDLNWMRWLHADLQRDSADARLRDLAVSKLKNSWLGQPPELLDNVNRQYIDYVCAQTGSCAQGKIEAKSDGSQFDPTTGR